MARKDHIAFALIGCFLGGAAHAAKVATDADACRIVTEHANHGTLETLVVPATGDMPEDKRNAIFGTDTYVPSSATYWAIDLDNDGATDDLAIGVEGTMSLGIGYVRLGKPTANVVKLLGDAEGDGSNVNPDLSVLAVVGRYYILSSSLTRSGLQKPGRLWRLGEDGQFSPVCSFTPRPQPVAELVQGQDSPICSLNREQMLPIDYPQRHALGALPDQDRWSRSPMDGVAQVDIDNDGQPENLVRISFAARDGRRCEARHLAVTDNTRSRIPNTQLNRLLLGPLGNSCAHNLDVYTFDGQTYIDADSEDGNRTIYHVNQDEAAVVCEFRGRLVYDMVRPGVPAAPEIRKADAGKMERQARSQRDKVARKSDKEGS